MSLPVGRQVTGGVVLALLFFSKFETLFFTFPDLKAFSAIKGLLISDLRPPISDLRPLFPPPTTEINDF
jgi:hypothetical protein